jgi:hypothetical protein
MNKKLASEIAGVLKGTPELAEIFVSPIDRLTYVEALLPSYIQSKK